MRSIAAVSLIVLSLDPAALAADKPTSVANAAGIVYGAITGREALIGICQEFDPDHSTDFVRIYREYVNSAYAMKVRAQEVIMTEAKRAGIAEEKMREVVSQNTEQVIGVFKKLPQVNPAFLHEQCKDLLSEAPIDAISDLRSGIPEAVEMVNRWH